MLRESVAGTLTEGTVAATAGVVDDVATPSMAGGRELRAFADAVALLDVEEMAIARNELLAVLGEPATRAAAGVCGYFAAMNRLLDATGVPVNDRYDMARDLGLSAPAHLRAG